MSRLTLRRLVATVLADRCAGVVGKVHGMLILKFTSNPSFAEIIVSSVYKYVRGEEFLKFKLPKQDLKFFKSNEKE